MAWLTSCGDTNKIVRAGGPWYESRYQFEGTMGIGGSATLQQYRRLHEPVTTEYVGVDLSTAQTYAENPTAETDYISARYERNGEAGAYRVIIESETVGAWEKYPPEA